VYADGAPGTKPKVPWSMYMRAIVSLFSVKLDVNASRSWNMTTSRGRTHAAATIEYDSRLFT
jgi:hypothetical protein